MKIQFVNTFHFCLFLFFIFTLVSMTFFKVSIILYWFSKRVFKAIVFESYKYTLRDALYILSPRDAVNITIARKVSGKHKLYLR